MKKLIVKKKQGIYVFPIDEIIYMEKNLRKILLYTMGHQIEFYGRFPEILPFLDGRFLYCHRSYLINMDQIVWMQYNEIYVANNERIPLGRDTFYRAKKIFAQYLAEKYPEKH